MRNFSWLALVAALAACRNAPAPTPRRPATPTLPAATCVEGTRWAPGTTAFREGTAAWGLDALKVEGTRLAVTDLDADGWPDLVVRRGGIRSDDFAEGGARHTWLLRNTRAGSFEDVTEASGFLAPRRAENAGRGRPGEVVAFADVDNDGDLDGYAGLTTSDPALSLGETSEVLLNDGHGVFALGPGQSGVRRAAAIDVPAGASFTDVDRDGLVDLWVPNHNYTPPGQDVVFMQDRLYRGDGLGSFEDVTEPFGLATSDWVDLGAINEARAHSRAWSAAACDLNGDGRPELLAASYGRAPNHLWQQAADGTFVNRSVASGYAYDQNFSWQDNHYARCFCRADRQAEGCEVVPEPEYPCGSVNWSHEGDREPYRLGGNSATTVCADVDNDGDLDLLTTEIRHSWAGSGSDHAELLVNTGEADVRFERPGREATGLVVPHDDALWDEGIMTASVFDFDNDGWPDVYLGGSDYPGNRGLLYHQAEPLRFEAVPIAEGIDHRRSHGVAVADFDRDGDLDVVVGHSRARCERELGADCYATQQVRLFENVLGHGGNWLQIRLDGAPGTNRAAIGARVTVRAGGVTQTQEVGGGYGHYGAQNDVVLHFGLGAACEAEVTVAWPNSAGTTQRHVLPAGHRILVTEGAAPRADGRR